MNLNFLNKSVKEFEFSTRINRALDEMGVHTIEQLIQKPSHEYLVYPNLSRKSVAEIEEVLLHMNLRLGTTAEEIKSARAEAGYGLDFHKELSLATISKAKDMAKQSLNAIIDRDEWTTNSIDCYFDEHKRIIEIYESAIRGLIKKPSNNNYL